jgi:putative peptidoglycan lipid II flippase
MLSTLFQYGRFDGHAVLMARQSLAAFALGITPFMLVKVLAAGFYAKQDMRTPVRIGVVAMLTNTALNLLFIWPLAHAGIALATSLAAFVNTSGLFYYLYKRGLYKPRAGWKLFSIRILMANITLAVWLYVGSADIHVWIMQSAIWRLTHLAFLLFSAIAIYFAALWLMGIRLQHLLMHEQPATSSS